MGKSSLDGESDLPVSWMTSGTSKISCNHLFWHETEDEAA
jgi:hypothetical protein